MGQLTDEDNTFWQLLHLAPGSSRWTPVTPTGTADNGGLVAAESGASVLAGVLPSGLLRFSPLSVSTDQATTWSPAFLPGALASLPDALALAPGPGGRVLAVVGSRVLVAPAGASSWSTLVSLSTLRRSASGCRAGRIQAVGFGPTGTPLVGLACSRGVGLLEDADGSWRQDAPGETTRSGGGPTAVLRLASTGAGTTVLAATRRSGRTVLCSLWQSTNGSWTVSPALAVPGPGPTATSIAATGEVAVLTDAARGLAIHVIAPGGTWTALPGPPRGTVAVAPSGTPVPADPSALDAFTVDGAALGVYQLAPSGRAWQLLQSTRIPLAYGSSS